MIAKLIVRDKDRESCIKKLLVALNEFIIDGITTNIELHRRILSHPDFRSGNFSTKFLDQTQLFD
jgi:acetyl-CoA carboxylase biotin carboxylase subunit